jgi:hypothetical protein
MTASMVEATLWVQAKKVQVSIKKRMKTSETIAKA